MVPYSLARRRFARAGMVGLIAACPVPYQFGLAAETRSWPVEIRSGQFEIHSDLQVLDQQTLIGHLSSVTADLQRVLSITMPKRPVHIVLFGTESEYQRYMQNYFPTIPQRRAIFLQDRGPGMLFAYWHSDVATDLRHEVVHALLNDSTGKLPMWLDEGIAEYFEVAPADRYSGSVHLDATVTRAGLGFVPELASLESIEAVDDFSAAHYRDSWAWVHYMMHRRKATRELLVRYLAERRSGAPAVPIHRQLQHVVPRIENDFQDHFTCLQQVIERQFVR